MYRGTTPTLRFKIPYTVDQINTGYITISRKGEVFMDIPFQSSSVSIEDYIVYVNLSQEDTLKFNSRTYYSIQLRILLNSGQAVASNIVTMPVSPILKNGVIGQEQEEIEVSFASGGLSILYSELVTLRDSGSLVQGMQYRITDYICTTTQEGTRVISNPFDIIVVADNESTLNENARACLHEQDEYYSSSDHQAHLESWELKYCIDNDVNRFAWADVDNGRGVIYWLKDDHDNECPYDFKQIQFVREIDGNTEYLYTFSVHEEYAEEIVYEDSSMFAQDVNEARCITYGNIIRPYYDSNDYGLKIQYLNNIVFNNIEWDERCTNNVFGFDCHSNTFGFGCHDNIFGNRCYENVFANLCHDNKFGNDVNQNTFNGFNNIVGNSFYNNTISGYRNIFGADCYNNIFGNNFVDNIIGNNCSNNTFGNGCSSNIIKSGFYSNILGGNLKNNTIEGGCSFISIPNTSSYQSIRYYHILSGTHGTSANNLLTINCTTNNTVATYVGNDSTGVLKLWVPADFAVE